MVSFRGAILFAGILLGSGCALLQSNPWPLLGEDDAAAFYLDRQSIERTAPCCFRYRIKIQSTAAHPGEAPPQTLQAMSVDMHCDDGEMAIRSHDVIDQAGKLLFRRPVLSPTFQTIPPDSIHQVMFNYLCSGHDI